ncbi:MAG: hypothetical protein DIZ78_07730 [endosymbiont of Escarpia spicata]|uniref:Uncharacterized protein n=1 Tax=endosymbiont of Escarpia spicata TaxID=2200908 RepID=A0A370DRJ5_9GAMM|nr:MAG: hypothetical protein DIZ78_07730 [endosymbiont of Escarpia spicata]
MPRHFRTLRLDLPAEAKPWNTVRENATKNIHCFLTHAPYLRDILLGKPIRNELFPPGGIIPRPMPSTDTSILDPAQASCAHLVAPLESPPKDFPQDLQTYMGRLRQSCMEEQAFDEQPCFILARADLWELGFKPDIGSPFLRIGDHLRTYLLWDDGGLWEQEKWPVGQDERLDAAWRGSGWLANRIATGDTYPFTGLEEQLDHSLDALVAQEPNNDPEQLHRQLLRILCGYLPKVKPDGERNRTPYPNDPYLDPGAPKPFTGLVALDRFELMLLLDGWLTPWRHKEGWHIQPGSLALLYWAARRMDYAHSGSPEAFISHYDWSAEAWFGGHLNLEQS